MIQAQGYGFLKLSFSSLYLILVVGSISRELVFQIVLHKTINVSFEMPVLWDTNLLHANFVRCYLCWVPFLWKSIFDKKSTDFVLSCQ